MTDHIADVRKKVGRTPTPCPFCGSTHLEKEILEGGDSEAIHCRECGVVGPPMMIGGDTWSAWNVRAVNAYDANQKTIAALLEAAKDQHAAIDILFSMLIERDKTFLPSKCFKP
jgi:transcription initiation factor TFIIIB Brf1 subunit/transcription initiation factor TFIIB